MHPFSSAAIRSSTFEAPEDEWPASSAGLKICAGSPRDAAVRTSDSATHLLCAYPSGRRSTYGSMSVCSVTTEGPSYAMQTDRLDTKWNRLIRLVQAKRSREVVADTFDERSESYAATQLTSAAA